MRSRRPAGPASNPASNPDISLPALLSVVNYLSSMYRMIDSFQVRAIADSFDQTGASVPALVDRIQSLASETRYLPSVARSIAWWQSSATDLRRLVVQLTPTPQLRAGPEWHQGPPPADQMEPPSRAASFFAGLSPLQATGLAQRFPDLIGPIDGAPLSLRYMANRLVAIHYLEDLRARRRDPIDSGRGLDWFSEDLWTLLRRAGRPFIRHQDSFDERLAHLDRRIADADRWAADDRRFLVFDPEGDGLVVEVLGDLETARHVAVIVPGVGHDPTNYEGGLRRSADSLYNSTNGSDTAVIAWLGYDTPDDLLAATDGRPNQASAALAKLLAGLDGSLGDGSHVSVIGHSYGSLVAGTAVQSGIPVDEIVFIGSPGVGVDHVSQLGLPSSTGIWAGRAGSDPIRLARDLECRTLAPICYPSTEPIVLRSRSHRPVLRGLPVRGRRHHDSGRPLCLLRAELCIPQQSDIHRAGPGRHGDPTR